MLIFELNEPSPEPLFILPIFELKVGLEFRDQTNPFWIIASFPFELIFEAKFTLLTVRLEIVIWLSVGNETLYFNSSPFCPTIIPVEPLKLILVNASVEPLASSTQFTPPSVVFNIFPDTPTA